MPYTGKGIWYKMAEAFGRAMAERMKNGKAAEVINASKIVDKANTPGIYKDKDMDLIHAYRRGQDEGGENYLMGLTRAQEASGKASPRRSDISREISRVEDENSSMRLQDAMPERFETDVASGVHDKMREQGKDMPFNDKFDEEALDMNREALTEEFKQALLDALKKHGAKSNYPDIVEIETKKFIED